MIRRAFVIVVFSALLAGCGHGGGARSVLPSGAGGTSGHALVPSSANLNVFNGTLWYGDDRSLRGLALTYGPSAEIDGSYAGLVGPSSRAMTVAQDGTVYELIQNDASGPAGWQLRIYAPGSSGAATPEETLSGNGYSRQVFLVGDGIDVLTTSGPNGAGTATLSTFAYGSANDAAPVRSASLGTGVLDAATDRYDRIYVAHGNGAVTVYPAAATCACSALRTIASGPFAARSLAVTDNGTVYVLADDPRGETANVLAYAPGNNGPSPSWTYGPFYESADVAPPGKAMSAPTGGITVDAAGDLYVGLVDNAGAVRVEEYQLGQPSGTLPWRTIPTPAFSTYLTSIAVGPVLPSGTPRPPSTLYVASSNRIYAFDANASGTAAPQRAFGSLYSYQQGQPIGGNPPPYHTASLVSIETALDGTVTAAQYLVGTNMSDVIDFTGCALTIFSANANGTSGVLSQQSQADCNYARVGNLARGYLGEIDFIVLTYEDAPAVVRTIDGSFASSFTLSGSVGAVASDPAGEIFVDEPSPDGNGTQVVVYDHLAQTGSPPIRSFTLPVPIGPACAAADGTYFGVASPLGPAYGTPSSIVAVAPGGSAVARTIGPFSDTVTAISCDGSGVVYVAFQTANGASTRVEAYSATANGAVPPLWTLSDPIPANEPGGRIIRSLALSPGAAPTIPGPATRGGSQRRTGPHGGRSLGI
jgi:hypothetical protein